ncbi:hypothetical protein PV416_15230 [Streptomyces ipomoeae]|uniref:Uncharacterized protein n=1 Tax=Streptomyces ipomoeae 91-03 TaxID=698759 RepID=L1KI35_9ACTN|nr:hypothetical protein [Streptomyces ipomoeae]EKX60214.1 hypothetical protein STRIP9103_01909 [Streptomyces ipomoeae 91-03]MDX2694656.1 hypothetical protein [Streptomyces ipomoeae]MDX2822420.1 hypothetical protein [Streptomyces ipomoeae]MDX2839447.1 hypothetical protein [Streptomyces ipomoeae]MDX2877097.1 hypothetical protein [Streptomyces ipomoeae]
MVEGKQREGKGSAQAVWAFLLGLVGRLTGAAITSWWNNRHGL